MYVQHMYHKVNGCADELAKRGTRQMNLVSVYNHCPSFVVVPYIRDLIGLGKTRLCNPSVAINVI